MPKTVTPQTAAPSGAKPQAANAPNSLPPAAKVQQGQQTRSLSWRGALLTALFRLLLLGVGGSITAAVGIAIAQLYPAQTQQLPLVTELAQRAEAKVAHSLAQLPPPLANLLPGSLTQSKPHAPQPLPALPAAIAPDPATTTSTLTEAEQQQMQTELTQLQAELQTLTSQTGAPLAERVEEIQKRIQSIQAKLNSFTATDPQPFVATPTVSTAVAANSNAAGDQPLLVTLPSDALFGAEEVTLRASTAAILDSILVDLQRYPEASIHVAAYTDQQQSAELDRQKSLEQARAVQKYLAGQMDESIHWVTVGQGHKRPLVPDDSEINRQRNRRIEISIVP